MSDTLDFQWEWQTPFEEGTPEGVTFASLRLLVAGRVATELEDLVAQTLRDDVFISAYPLACFLADNWWRLRWEPAPARPDAAWRLRHSLAAVGDGYAWPDVTFASDGEAVQVQVTGSRQSATSPVRYLASYEEWVPAVAFEHAVDRFLEGVMGRLEAMGQRDSDLTVSWGEIQKERANPHAARWRRLEAMAGYDPDEAPQAFIEALLGETESAGWPALQELAASSRSRALEDLKTLRDALHGRGIRYRVADLKQLLRRLPHTGADSTRPPWQRAAQAARHARLQWGLDGEVLSNRRLGEILDLPEEALGSGDDATPTAPYSASLRSVESGSDRLILKGRPTTSRRFAACRLIGDRLYGVDDDSPLAAATNAYTARQKFQRAFAQELLCPFDALHELLHLETASPSDDDIEGAAEHFQVSPLLVRTTLVNRHVLSRDVLDEAMQVNAPKSAEWRNGAHEATVIPTAHPAIPFPSTVSSTSIRRRLGLCRSRNPSSNDFHSPRDFSLAYTLRILRR